MYEYTDSDISIKHLYGTTNGESRKITKPMYDAFFKQLVKHREWVNGKDHRWNLWTLASYENFHSSDHWPLVKGVTVSYEDNAGENVVLFKRSNCQGWKVTTAQQNFVVVMHVLLA